MENARLAFLDAVRKSMRQIRGAIGATAINPKLLTAAERRTHPTSAVLSNAGYFAKRETLSLALRSSSDAGRGLGRVGAAAALVAG